MNVFYLAKLNCVVLSYPIFPIFLSTFSVSVTLKYPINIISGDTAANEGIEEGVLILDRLDHLVLIFTESFFHLPLLFLSHN